MTAAVRQVSAQAWLLLKSLCVTGHAALAACCTQASILVHGSAQRLRRGDEPEQLQTIRDQLGPNHILLFFERWLRAPAADQGRALLGAVDAPDRDVTHPGLDPQVGAFTTDPFRERAHHVYLTAAAVAGDLQPAARSWGVTVIAAATKRGSVVWRATTGEVTAGRSEDPSASPAVRRSIDAEPAAGHQPGPPADRDHQAPTTANNG